MTLAEELSADLTAGVADYEQTFEWEGTSYPCVRNPEPVTAYPEEGGQVETLAERILVTRAAFHDAGALPQIGDAIDNGAKQIKSIDPNLAQLILHVDSWD